MQSADKKSTPRIEKIGRVSSVSVHKCTGRHWDEWVKLLDKERARTLTHPEIVKLLKTKYKLSPWWQQGVTTSYEIHIGRRVEGQNQKGEYATVATKTFPIDAGKAWKLLTSEKGMRAWLNPLTPFKIKPDAVYEVEGGFYGQVRTMKAGLRVRMTWQTADWTRPSVITVMAIARPENKCMIVIQHDGLKNARMRDEMRAHWKQALIALSEQ